MVHYMFYISSGVVCSWHLVSMSDLQIVSYLTFTWWWKFNIIVRYIWWQERLSWLFGGPAGFARQHFSCDSVGSFVFLCIFATWGSLRIVCSCEFPWGVLNVWSTNSLCRSCTWLMEWFVQALLLQSWQKEWLVSNGLRLIYKSLTCSLIFHDCTNWLITPFRFIPVDLWRVLESTIKV